MLLLRTVNKSLDDIRSSRATFIKNNTEKKCDKDYLPYITGSVTYVIFQSYKTTAAIARTLFHVDLLI